MNILRHGLRSLITFSLLVLASVSHIYAAEKPFEHHMRLVLEKGAPRTVAVTLDGSSNNADPRILDVLINERIPVTLFVTGIWLENNPDVVKTLLAHPDLFQLENHGYYHIPPVIGTKRIYGLMPAGTMERVAEEVSKGHAAFIAAGAPAPTWYRGATALYSPEVIPMIEGMGYKIAGFSLNADYGASAAANVAKNLVAGAKDGDVIIAHINQPTRSSGAGIAAGLLKLKAQGVRFVLLKNVEVTEY